MLNKTRKLYSPTINRYFKKLSIKKKDYLQECGLSDDLHYLTTPTIMVHGKCEKVTTKKAKQRLKRNLYSKKLIRAEHVITPKQTTANCWFNTFFVNFFISDRGRQFTKYLRYCMIEGRRMSKTAFSKNEAKILAYLNIAIDASLTGNKVMYNFDTNKLILFFHKILQKKQNYEFPNIHEAGNPSECYEDIVNNIEGNKYSPYFTTIEYNQLHHSNVVYWNTNSRAKPYTLYDLDSAVLPKYWIRRVHPEKVFRYSTDDLVEWVEDIFRYKLHKKDIQSFQTQITNHGIKGIDIKNMITMSTRHSDIDKKYAKLIYHELTNPKNKYYFKDHKEIFYHVKSHKIEPNIDNVFLPEPGRWSSSFSGNNVPTLLIYNLLNGKEFGEDKTLEKNETNSMKPETIILITKDKKKIKYKLDSVVIRDTRNQHVCSVLTYNNRLYKFDGASFSRLQPFNWKPYLNKDKEWGFKGVDLRWNFMNGSQELFYYRV